MEDIYQGKTVLIFGLGRFGGGVDSARFAAGQGAKVVVTDALPAEKLSAALADLCDLPGIEYRLGGHDEADFQRADIVIVNPAVPPENELLDAARKAGKQITSQVAIFFENCPAPIIGITGSNGKSTTAALTAHLLRAGVGREGFSRREIRLGGNIGNQPLLCVMGEISPEDLVVLELSSFQLEQLAWENLAPQVSVITNLAPNHLDRHGTMAAYAAAKENIFRLQKGTAANPAIGIFPAHDDLCRGWYEKYGRDPVRRCLLFSEDDVPASILSCFPLPGRANRQNLAAAWHIARVFGVRDEWMAAAVGDFRGLPHRLELVRERGGVRWYNDSIATTPESTVVALEAFEAPAILIAGGYDKQLPFDGLGRSIAARAKAAILIGATAGKIRDAILAAGAPEAMIHCAPSMPDAVQKAVSMAENGDVVLMSPACASYDMFENFQHRSRAFCDAVNALP